MGVGVEKIPLERGFDAVLAGGKHAAHRLLELLLVDAMAEGERAAANVWLPLWLFLGLIVTENILWRLGGWLGCRTVVASVVDIRVDLFRHLTGHPMRYFNEHFAGSLGNRISALGAAAGGIYGSLAWKIVPPVIDFLGAVILLYFVDWRMAVALVLFVFIVADAAVEQCRFLRYHGDFLPQAVLTYRTDVMPVDHDATGLYIIQPLDKTDQCGFACARRPYYANLLTRRDTQVESGKNLLAVRIGVTDVFKNDLTISLPQLGLRIIQRMGLHDDLKRVVDRSYLLNGIDQRQGKIPGAVQNPEGERTDQYHVTSGYGAGDPKIDRPDEHAASHQ